MKSSNRTNLVTIGRVLKAKGVESRLTVLPLTFDPKRFLALRNVYFDKDGKFFHKVVENVEISGKYVLLKIKGVDSPEAASIYSDCIIKIPETESPELPEETYYYYQIIGLDVFTDSGHYLGKVQEILETGSNDVYSVVNNDREVLIPVIKEVVKEISIEENRIVIHPMKGLLNDF